MSKLRHLAMAYMDRVAATTELPSSFPATEVGLMTREEFLDYRNPDGKMHPSDAYDFTLFSLNEDHNVHVVDRGEAGSALIEVYQATAGHYIRIDERLSAVIHNGTMYHTRGKTHLLPEGFLDRRQKYKWTPFGVKKRKVVKYLHEYMSLVSPMAKKNRKEYPVVHKRIKAGDEFLEIRFEKSPEKDKGIGIGVLNASGQIVAQASNEWGATLIAVAQEYRGKGLGTVLGKIWYEWNPKFTSGGFTSSGLRNAEKIWEKRVREFLSQGWYTALVRESRLTTSRVKEILSGIGERVRKVKKTPPSKGKKEVLILVEDSSFVIYDKRFLDNPGEDYIYGHGLFRDSPSVGDFLFRIDYERPYHKIATYVALQMARDNGEKIYIGPGYGDTVEWEGLDGVEQEGDYIWLSSNAINLRSYASKEKRIRKSQDPYQEKWTLLLEMADSKWR